MKCTTTAIVAVFTTLAVAAALPADPACMHPKRPKGSAILQFEIDNDTFTSDTMIKVPGLLRFPDCERPMRLIAATIAITENIPDPAVIRCQAFDKYGWEAIGPAFGSEDLVKLADGQRIEIGRIICI